MDYVMGANQVRTNLHQNVTKMSRSLSAIVHCARNPVITNGISSRATITSTIVAGSTRIVFFLTLFGSGLLVLRPSSLDRERSFMSNLRLFGRQNTHYRIADIVFFHASSLHNISRARCSAPVNSLLSASSINTCCVSWAANPPPHRSKWL